MHVKSVQPMSWTKRDAAATFQRMVEERHAEIGRRIAQLREAKGWNQETLAHEAGVAVRTISRLENGGNEGRGGTMRSVAEALGTDIAGLLGGAQVMNSAVTFEDGTTITWDARLDQIEAKLDLIMDHLNLSLSETRRPGDAVKKAVQRRDGKESASQPARPKPKPKDQAA